MSGWNFADVWETLVEVKPEPLALINGDRRLTWAEMSARADGLAQAFLDAGVGQGSKVGEYLYNGVEYLETLFAAFKIGAVPVNTNYRYTADELIYLWDNADAEAVVFDAAFVERVEEVRGRLPKVKTWVQVGGEAPAWALSYEALATAEVEGPVVAPWGRSGEDLLFIYTGGTTGMPKGVMWRQEDLFLALNAVATLKYDPESGLEGVRAVHRAPLRYPPTRMLPGPPLMHGTGLFTAMSVLATGGRIVMPQSRHFDAESYLDVIAAEGITEMSIVGDAFARPLLKALEDNPGRWELSALWLMVSSGVMWSSEVKDGLKRHIPELVMVDSLGSSEAIGLASSRSDKAATSGTGDFKLNSRAQVLDESGAPVVPGSGQRGMVAVRGPGPVGYYKDPDKSAATFRIINGERWTIPGDWAEVSADGQVKLLGRGSLVINSGGEKIFPEEVEEALKTAPGVVDAVAVGVPDERFGEIVVAWIQTHLGEPVDEEATRQWVRKQLAGYKVPKHLLVTSDVARAPNGKVDYKRLKAEAVDLVAAGT